MIKFGNYYYIQENDIVAIELGKNVDSKDYPFRLVVRTRNDYRYTLSYRTEDAASHAAADMARQVECATRDRDMEQIFNKLWMMKSDLSKLDKRQLKIWRQLKELLGLKDKEETP